MHKAYTGKTTRLDYSDIMTDLERADIEYNRIDERIPIGYIVALFSLCCIILEILLLVYIIFFVGLRQGL